MLGDQRDVLADAEVVVGGEAEEVDAELDVERLERLARRGEEARDRRVHGLGLTLCGKRMVAESPSLGKRM